MTDRRPARPGQRPRMKTRDVGDCRRSHHVQHHARAVIGMRQPMRQVDRNGTLRRDEQKRRRLRQGGQRKQRVLQCRPGHTDHRHHQVQSKRQRSHQPEQHAQVHRTQRLRACFEGAAVPQRPRDRACGDRGGKCGVLCLVVKSTRVVDDPARGPLEQQRLDGQRCTARGLCAHHDPGVVAGCLEHDVARVVELQRNRQHRYGSNHPDEDEQPDTTRQGREHQQAKAPPQPAGTWSRRRRAEVPVVRRV